MIHTVGKLLGAAFLDPKRTPPARQMPYPNVVYHPMSGMAGTTEEPRVGLHRTNIPSQRQDHPSGRVAGTNWENHVITGDPRFWDAYEARKRQGWGNNYTQAMQLTHDYTLPRTELRYHNIATGEHLGSLTRRSPTTYHPIQMGVPNINMHKTRQ